MVQMKALVESNHNNNAINLYIPHGSDESPHGSDERQSIFSLYPTWFR